MTHSRVMVLPQTPPSSATPEKSGPLSGSQIPHMSTEGVGPGLLPHLPALGAHTRGHRNVVCGSFRIPPAASRTPRILHQAVLANRIFRSRPHSLICLPRALADGLAERPPGCLRLQALGTEDSLLRWARVGRHGGGNRSGSCSPAATPPWLQPGPGHRLWVTAAPQAGKQNQGAFILNVSGWQRSFRSIKWTPPFQNGDPELKCILPMRLQELLESSRLQSQAKVSKRPVVCP